MSRTITQNDLKPLVEKKGVTVLDVRRQNDYDADMVKLPGAEWKNPEQLADWSAKLPKEKEIVILRARRLGQQHGARCVARQRFQGTLY